MPSGRAALTSMKRCANWSVPLGPVQSSISLNLGRSCDAAATNIRSALSSVMRDVRSSRGALIGNLLLHRCDQQIHPVLHSTSRVRLSYDDLESLLFGKEPLNALNDPRLLGQ